MNTSLERSKARKFLKDAEKEEQEGMGQRQQESPAKKKYLDQGKGSADTGYTPRVMRFGSVYTRNV